MEPLIAVVGATGTGKSKLAVDLASRFNGEIINGDAMQMYRGLPIITNQIPVEERNGIPHHLIGCIGLEKEPWRVGIFKKECLRLIKDIHSRGKLPILVGGTHYYTQTVLFKDQLVDREEAGSGSELDDSESSEKWPILNAPTDVLLQKLREVDPSMASRWHPNETRKIRRSLEIYFQTGRPASEIYAEQRRQRQIASVDENSASGRGLRYQTLIFWVHADKEILNSRLDARVDTMIEQGLMSEAERMLLYIQEKQSQGLTVDQTKGVWVSIGFKELGPYFSALRDGSSTGEELGNLRRSCVESIKTATRQYAVSQIKWIRNKLWRALAETRMTSRLYLLDSSNVDHWDTCVKQASERLVYSFLHNEPCPGPKSLSELARVTLEAKEAQAQKPTSDLPKCVTCDICRKTMMNEEQWNAHVKGQGHKRALKAAAKRAEREEFLRKRESLENTQSSANGN